ncbi:hypothetical protein RSOL_420290, partial [Rhizoctonia solani AG-3 Rhs1AP]
MFAPTQFEFAQPTFDASFTQPAFDGQQPEGQFWVDISNFKFDSFDQAAPALEHAVHQGAVGFNGNEYVLDDTAGYLPLFPSQGVGAPEVAHFPQAVPGAQTISPFEPMPQPPVVVPSQPFFAPQLAFSIQPALGFPQAVPGTQVPLSTFEALPQPPMLSLSNYRSTQPFLNLLSLHRPPPLSRRALPPAPASAPQPILSPECVEKEAVRARRILALFRINQKHNPSVRSSDPDSELKLCSKLGLTRRIAVEYRAVLEEGIPLFVSQTTDWDAAFSLLGEITFHMFRGKELEKAQRMGRTLPPLRPVLEQYINMFPPHEEIERRFRELPGVAGVDF